MDLADWVDWVTFWRGLGPEPATVDPDSAEACFLRDLAGTITECEAAQELAEVGTSDAVMPTVVIGPHEGPWQGDKFTVDELAARFVEFQLFIPPEGGRVVVNDGVVGDRGNENSVVQMTTRRYARAAELEGVGRAALYFYFVDKIAALEEQIVVRAKETGLSLLSLTRDQGPAFGTKKSQTAQGEYLFATHSFTWGDYGTQD